MFTQYLADFTDTFRTVRWLMGMVDVGSYAPLLGVLPVLVIAFSLFATLPRSLDLISLGADAATAREGAAWFVSFYVVSMGTFYRDSLSRQGFDKEVQAVLAANTPKLRGVVPPDAEELLEQLIVFGTPAEARRRLQRWHAAGAREVGLLLRPQLTADEIAFTLDAFRPLLESSAAGR